MKPTDKTEIANIWPSVLDQLHRTFDPLLGAFPDRARADDLVLWLFSHLAAKANLDVPETVQNMRVAACIALDTKTGNITGQDMFERVLNRVNRKGFIISTRSELAPYLQFHNATSWSTADPPTAVTGTSQTPGIFYRTSFQTSSHPEGGYCRCLSLPTFFNYMVTKSTDYLDTSMRLNDYIADCYGDGGTARKVAFPEIPVEHKVMMTGMKPLCWVFPSAVLEELGTEKVPVRLAKKLAIPFSEPNDTDRAYQDVLVLIQYPQDFSGEAFQPSSIHADWRGGGFLSYRKNTENYGRTADCEANYGEGARERIHIAFPLVTSGPGAMSYTSTILGAVGEEVKLDTDMLLLQTLHRFCTL
jgi:hypothetical protein